MTEVPHPITSTNLMPVTREGVAALGEDDAALGLRPTGADSVHAQYDRIICASAEKLPKVADHLDAARPDLLARSPHSPSRSGRTIRRRTSIRKSVGQPMWLESSPIARPDSARRSGPRRTTRRVERRAPLSQPERAGPLLQRHPTDSTSEFTEEVTPALTALLTNE
nr:transposase domain protein [Rhodococcus sp. JVH1]